jgi:hypothetical protein
MSDNATKETIDFMLRKFKPERYAYLIVTIISFLILLVCVILYIMDTPNMDKKNLGPIIGMVGSGGAIAYTASQLLRMWGDCMKLFSNSLDKDSKS